MILFIFLIAFVLIAVGLAWFLVAHDHGEREPIGALWIAFGFGFLGGIASGVLEGVLIPHNALAAGAPLLTLLVAALAVGVIEEAAKFIPLSIFIYPKRFFNEHTDGIIYFAIAGLGFGLPENIMYTIQFGSSAGIGRLFLTPVFHSAMTAMVGYFLIKGKLAGKSRTESWIFLGIAMLLHGLYDFGLTSGVGLFALMSVIITISMTIMIFVLYSRATELDQERGLSAVGHNSFCRSCGQPNTNHLLYCSHCGKRA